MKTSFNPVALSDFFKAHCIWIILLLAAVMRIPCLAWELQYDELWTLIHFTKLDVSRILTDVSLPNNHPVNTIILKLLQNISSSPSVLRLGVFVCGLGVTALVMQIASTGGKAAAAAAGILSAASMQFILFSVVARGYIFQLLALLTCAYALLAHAGGSSSRKMVWLIIIGGIFSFISVSSGIMFLAVLGCAYLFSAPPEHRFDKPVIIAGTILLAAALAYYLPLCKQLRSGQQWGIEISSAAALLKFILNNIKAHLMPFTAILAAVAAYSNPLMRKLLLFSLLPLLLALVTKGGPERVYLPLSAVYIIIAGFGFDILWKRWKKQRLYLVLALAAGAALNFAFAPAVWQIPRPTAELHSVLQESSGDVLPILPSTAGFPAMLNDPQAAGQLELRAINPPKYLLMTGCSDGVFNGADMSNAEKVESFPVSGSVFKGSGGGYLYPLTPIAGPAPGETVLVIFRSGNIPDSFLRFPGKKLRLNIWINRRIPLYICNFTDTGLPPSDTALFFRIGAEK